MSERAFTHKGRANRETSETTGTRFHDTLTAVSGTGRVDPSAPFRAEANQGRSWDEEGKSVLKGHVGARASFPPVLASWQGEINLSLSLSLIVFPSNEETKLRPSPWRRVSLGKKGRRVQKSARPFFAARLPPPLINWIRQGVSMSCASCVRDPDFAQGPQV